MAARSMAGDACDGRSGVVDLDPAIAGTMPHLGGTRLMFGRSRIAEPPVMPAVVS
jgi:hypothetical protein